MFADNTLTPKETVRLCALGTLALGATRYSVLANSIRHFISRITGPSLDVMGISIELLKHEGLVEAANRLAIEDDVVIMHNGKLEACFVAFPSSWNAGEKVGKSLVELHEPIADNEALLRASDGIMRAMTSGQSYHRYTWGISSLNGYSNHPLYEKPEFDSLDNLTFRVEHERTMTVTEGTTAVFLIHVDIYPLKEVLKTDFGLIKGAIDSMTDSVLEYKNLFKVKELMNEYLLST